MITYRLLLGGSWGSGSLGGGGSSLSGLGLLDGLSDGLLDGGSRLDDGGNDGLGVNDLGGSLDGGLGSRLCGSSLGGGSLLENCG